MVNEAKFGAFFFFFNTPVHVSVSRKKCLKIATVVDSLKYMAQFLKI